MIKHLLKLVWNRKRGNILITLEIFVCFLVLFATVVMVGYYANNYRKPLGYEYRNVWSVGTSMSTLADLVRGQKDVMQKWTAVFYDAMRNMPEIEAVSSVGQAPYTFSWHTASFEYRGKSLNTAVNEASDNLPKVLKLQIVRGRWFDKTDDGLAWDPVVINERLARSFTRSVPPTYGRGVDNALTIALARTSPAREPAAPAAQRISHPPLSSARSGSSESLWTIEKTVNSLPPGLISSPGVSPARTAVGTS